MKIIKEIYVAAFLSVSVFSYAQDTKMINRGFNLSGRSEESTAAVSTIYMDDSKTSDINRLIPCMENFPDCSVCKARL